MIKYLLSRSDKIKNSSLLTFLFLLIVVKVSFTQEQWINFTESGGLANNWVTSIAIDSEGNKWFATERGVSFLGNPATISTGTSIPVKIYLYNNYPNPFNTETNIRYQLPEASHVSLKIYNMNGQIVRTLVNEDKNPGCYKITWDGRNKIGIRIASGVYLYVLKAKGNIVVKKMVFLK